MANRTIKAVAAAAALLALTACQVPFSEARGTATTPAPGTAATSKTASTSDAVPAAAALATLQVKGKAAKTGYSRPKFGPAWTDANGDLMGRNGCDTRSDVLRRDLSLVEAEVRHAWLRTLVRGAA